MELDKNLFNVKSFNLFITTALNRIAIDEKRNIQFNAPVGYLNENDKTYIYEGFDAIVYDGILGLSGIIVFEFKYSTKSIDQNTIIQNLNRRIKKLLPNKDVTLVIITNQICEGSHDSVNTSEYIKIKSMIFDANYIQKWINKYPIDFNNSISKYNISDSMLQTKLEDEITEKNFLENSKSNEIELNNIINSNECFSIVLGAGISVEPGSKSWNDLLRYFAKELENKDIICDSEKLGKKIGGSSIFTAQLCKELYKNESDYFWAIHQGLYEGRKAINTDYALYQISKIIQKHENKKRFKILTYNYDEYLENYLYNLGVSYNSLFDCECIINNKISIYHVHGFLPNVNSKSYIPERNKKSIYLTEENYNTLYNHPYSWQISSQLSCFRESTCLFVGCSLADPNIRRLLEMTAKEHKNHYAILTKDNMVTKDLLKVSSHFARVGIKIIWVNNHASIAKQLREFYN